MREARVVGEEGAGAEQHGAIAVVGQFRNHPVMQWRGIEKYAGAGQQRQQGAAGEAEGMEHRQRVEEFVFRRQIDHRAYLRNVGQQRAMRQHDALRLAFRAGREQHHGGRFRISRRGGQILRDQHPQLVEQADASGQVFQIQNALLAQAGQTGLQLAGGDEAARGDHGFDFRRRAGIAQTFRAGGVIEQRGNATARRQAEQQRDGGGKVGQQHANRLAFPRRARRHATQAQCHAQQFAVVEFDLLHVFQQRPPPAVDGDGIDEGSEQGLPGPRAEHHFLHDAAHRFARVAAALFGGAGFRHGDASGGQNGQCDAW